MDWAKWRAEVLENMLALGMSEERAALETREAEERMRARLGWLRGQFDALNAAHDKCADACADLSEQEIEEGAEPPEFAEVKRIERAIGGVRDNDSWPPHLYWGKI